MYIFGNLILQGLKGYITWRKPNANKKKINFEVVYDWFQARW